MYCVCLQEDEEKKYKCVAKIGTSPWTIDSDTVRELCKTEEFVKCKRLITFLDYTRASNAIKVQTTKN